MLALKQNNGKEANDKHDDCHLVVCDETNKKHDYCEYQNNGAPNL